MRLIKLRRVIEADARFPARPLRQIQLSRPSSPTAMGRRWNWRPIIGRHAVHRLNRQVHQLHCHRCPHCALEALCPRSGHAISPDRLQLATGTHPGQYGEDGRRRSQRVSVYLNEHGHESSRVPNGNGAPSSAPGPYLAATSPNVGSYTRLTFETGSNPVPGTPDAAPVRLIVRRVKPPGSQLTFITDADWSGRADRDHQDPQAAGLRSGGTDHPLGAPPHFASPPALALGNPVQSRLGPAASHSVPGLTASLQLTQRPRNLAPPRSRESPAALSPSRASQLPHRALGALCGD